MQFLYIKDVALLSDRKGLAFLNVIQRHKKLRGEKEYITTMMLKYSLGILCSPNSHSLLHLPAELPETLEKGPDRGNRTEKQKTATKMFICFLSILLN